MRRYNTGFYKVVKNILVNKDFNKLKDIDHHGISRYDHSLRVAYYTYVITKGLRLDYEKATRGAMLHDFFIDEVVDMDGIQRLRKHPSYALKNAKKHYNLSPMEEDIIKTHMFPVTFRPPKYLESWLVDIIDDIAAIYERSFSVKRELSTSLSVFALMIINYIR